MYKRNLQEYDDNSNWSSDVATTVTSSRTSVARSQIKLLKQKATELSQVTYKLSQSL